MIAWLAYSEGKAGRIDFRFRLAGGTGRDVAGGVEYNRLKWKTDGMNSVGSLTVKDFP